ncbi:Na+/H+ antiporter subunit D [Bacillus chungangensis]|uniref:Multicomponent Na+:H+ antiporter subunit D n=1 Tax=Bacillus chungangensis TaxID=587633 RepID=A0ABT9WZR1_9BACI|nr:Na+/H+ antiporter subunit D [Bacillus chungangensis]MDQ0178578.1 multicomponent Na+:H+ antiporter subunit D [Bacillus chungangensis]
MINLLLVPIIIPLFTALLLIFIPKKVVLQRAISIISAIATTIAALILVGTVRQDGIQVVDLGGWPAPFGITLVSDMLSALLVTTASIITLTVILFSFRSIGEEREKYYYYSMVQFLLVGVNGAFTTGDIFNMFVFFEVMLMSSYVLLVIGGTKIQLRETIKYILVNVISSALFVITVAYLYSVVGTLNMAHISVRISEIQQPGILTVIAIMFLIVFGLKGAIFPLYFWLPGSYYAPPPAIMALFGALLTKVGVYSILRTYTLFFYHDIGYTHQILGVLSILTIIVGIIGAIAYQDIKKMIIFNIIIAIGVITYGISMMSTEALTGSVFYLIHDMLIKAALFFLVGIIMAITGTADLRKFSGLINHYPFLGWTFFISTLTLAGIPPFSGFVGKLLIAKGGFAAGDFIGALIVLLSSLFVLYSLMKVFLNGFWGETKGTINQKAPVSYLLVPTVLLVAITVIYGFGAEWINIFISQAADVLTDPSIYIDAVLKE